MYSSFKKLPQVLINLDKKAEELDEVLKNVRAEIHNALWDLIELTKNKYDKWWEQKKI